MEEGWKKMRCNEMTHLAARFRLVTHGYTFNGGYIDYNGLDT